MFPCVPVPAPLPLLVRVRCVEVCASAAAAGREGEQEQEQGGMMEFRSSFLLVAPPWLTGVDFTCGRGRSGVGLPNFPSHLNVTSRGSQQCRPGTCTREGEATPAMHQHERASRSNSTHRRQDKYRAYTVFRIRTHHYRSSSSLS